MTQTFKGSLKSAKKRGIWVTKDAREIKISDLTDAHLVNIIKMAKRYGQRKRFESMELAMGMSFQGEMAQYCLDQYTEQLIESDWMDHVEGIEELLAEAEKRNVSYD